MRGGEGGARRRRCGVSISNHRDEAEDADDEEAPAKVERAAEGAGVGSKDMVGAGLGAPSTTQASSTEKW